MALKCAPVAAFFQRPLAKNAVSLATAARPAKEHLRRGTIDQRILRPGLRTPDVLSGT